MLFTDKYLKGVKPQLKKYTLTERTGERGESRLQVNVYPTDVKKFQIQYFLDGKRKRMEFGKFGGALGDYSLRDARIKFSELAAMVKKGIDPKYPDKSAKQLGLETLQTLYTYFLAWYKTQRKTNSYNTVLGFLDSNMTPHINMDMAANEFTADHGRELIYPVWNRGSKEAALGLKSALSRMFKYGIDYDNGPERYGKPPVFGILANPIRDISLDHAKTPGSRWLDEKELKIVWYAEDMHPTLNRFLRLQIALAGQRIEEVSHCNTKEFDITQAIFTVPTARVKITARGDHVLPIGKIAIDVHNQCLKFRSQNGLLFPSARDKALPITVKSLRNALNSWLAKNPKFNSFTLRDIRRTCKTHMSKAGVNRDHRDMLQQHYKSDVATVHYDRHDYLAEKRKAVEVWNDYLEKIIGKK